jgi:hypothetical protein
MTRYWLAGAAAFALMTSVAFAQGMSSESSSSTQSTTTTTVPTVGSYSSSETQHGTDSYGNTVDKSKTYNSGAGGTNATSASRITAPDGSVQSTSQEKQTNTPDGGSIITKKTTTTTTDR